LAKSKPQGLKPALILLGYAKAEALAYLPSKLTYLRKRRFPQHVEAVPSYQAFLARFFIQK
jgi:hypothetical protein